MEEDEEVVIQVKSVKYHVCVILIALLRHRDNNLLAKKHNFYTFCVLKLKVCEF